MAKVKLNPVLQKIQGKFGDIVFKRHNQNVVMSRKSDGGDKPPTEAQVAQRRKFLLATRYAKSVLNDSEKKAFYESAAKSSGTPVYALAVGDYLKSPVVDEIDLSGYTGKAGETIRIQAHDDFEVTGVEVAITDSNGAVLEQGAAVSATDTLEWTYVTTTELPDGTQVSVTATAIDHLGHKGTKTAEIG
jgi:hypothetical protein